VLRGIVKALLVLLGLVLLLVAVLLVNTWRQGSRQLAVEPLPRLAVDEAGAAASLAAAVRARTISGLPDASGLDAEFERLQAHLRERYPRLHADLQREVVGAHSLLFTWAGSDPSAKPIGLMAHQDVVPIAPDTEGAWQQPPFSGAIEGGYVWGRGTWDDKGNLVAQMEAIEQLLTAGFRPRRTVYLIYGHDEELSGEQGAAKIAGMLQQRGVKLDFVIDEGLLITDGVVPGLSRPAALVGIAEKGILSVRLRVEGAPGHSSMPPPPGQSAIAVLSAALSKLDQHPVPGGLQGTARQTFDDLAPEMSGVNRIVLSNLWLLGPVVERMLEKSPSTNAVMRTTTALTIVQAGNKENVLPGLADATVNFRLLPGDTSDRIVEFVRRVVDDDRVSVEALPTPQEPSRVSSVDSDAYRHVERTIREVFPDVIVAPGLYIAAADARHFEAVADQVFRFSPVRANAEDLKRFHGTNERLSIANLADMIRFYHRLVQQAAS